MAKTALELSAKEWKAYRLSELMALREKREDTKMKQRFQDAWSSARKAAFLLRKHTVKEFK